MRNLAVLTVCMVITSAVALGQAATVHDYEFKRVDGKPAVIPGLALSSISHLCLTGPNPADTGQGTGHQYLGVYGQAGSYDQRVLLLHRLNVTPYDDYQGKNSTVEQLNCGNDLTPQDDGRQGCVDGAVLRIFTPIGRMTPANYWILARGEATGAYNEWQPRDARSGSVTSNEFLVYPDSDPGNDGLGVSHTTSASSDWGCAGYNKRGSVHVETFNAGTAGETNRGVTFGYFWTSPYQWGSGIFEVGPWQDPGDPMSLGTRTRLSSHSFMSSGDVDNLVAGVNDVFRSWFHDGRYLYYLTAGAGDNKVYLSAVEITDWSNGTWQQADISSGAELYQAFTFDSGNADTSLTNASGLVFAPDLDNPSGPPLLYIANGKRRIFVLQAIVPFPSGTVFRFR